MIMNKDLGIRRTGFKGVILLISLFILCGWSTPINISNTDSTSYIPSACLDFSGRLHVVWEERTPLGDLLNDIYYTCQVGSVWTIPVNVSNDSFASWGPDVAVDTLGRVHVVWESYINTWKIMWTMYEDGVWTTPISISDSVPYACQGCRIAVNPIDNTVHCVWHDLDYPPGGGKVWHSYFDGNKWSVPEGLGDTVEIFCWPDIAVDSLGRLHLVAQNFNSPDHEGTHIYYTRFENGSWLPFEDITPNCEGTVDPRIAIDRDNNPHVVWEERTGVSKIYYTYFDGSRWLEPILVGENESMHPTVAVDEIGKTHITWEYHAGDTFNVVYYACYYQGVCETTKVQVSANNPYKILMPQIWVRDSIIHVVWEDHNLGNSEIFYSYTEYFSSVPEIDNGSFPFVVIGSFSFTFSLTSSSFVTLSFYDVCGREVYHRDLGYFSRGTHHCDVPLSLPSGVYFPILKAGAQVFRGKIIFINP